MNERLLPGQRIRSPSLFRTLYKQGVFVRGKLLFLWLYRGPGVEDTEKPKIGVVVSRKTSLRAVKRNLWKRRIKEAFRKEQKNISAGTAVLIKASYRKIVPEYQEIEQELKGLLKEAKKKAKKK